MKTTINHCQGFSFQFAVTEKVIKEILNLHDSEALDFNCGYLDQSARTFKYFMISYYKPLV